MPKPKSKSKSKKPKAKKVAKPRKLSQGSEKPKKLASNYVGYLIWFKVDLWKKKSKKAAEAIAKVRDQVLNGVKNELDAKTIVVREDQPKDTATYVLLDLDEATQYDLLNKFRTIEAVEYLEVEHYAGIDYGDKQ